MWGKGVSLYASQDGSTYYTIWDWFYESTGSTVVPGLLVVVIVLFVFGVAVVFQNGLVVAVGVAVVNFRSGLFLVGV